MVTAPPCPLCQQPLKRVTQGPYSPLNSDQFDAVKAGDWFCECSSNGRSATLFAYFWDWEVSLPTPSAPPSLRDKALEYLRLANKLSPDILETVTELTDIIPADEPESIIKQSPIVCCAKQVSGLGLLNGFLLHCGERPIVLTTVKDGVIIKIE